MVISSQVFRAAFATVGAAPRHTTQRKDYVGVNDGGQFHLFGFFQKITVRNTHTGSFVNDLWYVVCTHKAFKI